MTDGDLADPKTVRESMALWGEIPDVTFEEWCDELNKLSAAEPNRYGEGDLIKICGAECWRQYYDDGYSPQDAWDEDGTYAD